METIRDSAVMAAELLAHLGQSDGVGVWPPESSEGEGHEGYPPG